MNNFLNLVKAHKIISAILVVAVVAGGYGWYKHAKGSTVALQYVTAAVQKQTVTVAVTTSGQISEQNQVAIKPQASGQLTAVSVKQGDQVKTGQTIAIIDERSAALSLSQARAALQTAQASYSALVAGPTGTDLAVDQDPIQSAQQNLNNAKNAYSNVVAQQKTAVANALSSLLNSGLTAQPSQNNSFNATITISGAYTGPQGSYVLTVSPLGAGLGYNISGLEQASGTITNGIAQPLGNNGLFFTFTSTNNNLVGSWTINIPNPQASGYLSASNAYQTALQNQTQALATAQQQVDAAQLSLTQAQDSYNQKVAPPTQAQLDSAQAQIQSAQAQLQAAEIAYDNNILKAPFDGIVAQLNNHKGDQVSGSDTVATIITAQQIANVSLNEVDVSKIKLGDKATLSFDALPDLSLTGTVAEVDTLGTTTQGVVTYNVQIGLDTQNDQVKPGMSVSADIITDVATDVLAVPNSAVKNVNGATVVQVLDQNGKPQNKPVEVGISNDTVTVITSGLNEGDKVITQTINPNAKTTTATSSSAVSGLRIPGLGAGGAGGGFGGGGNRTGAGGAAGANAGRGN